MIILYRPAAFILVMTLLSPFLNAQDSTWKARVFGGVGIGRFFDDEGSLGLGATYRAGAEWRPLSRLGVQGELLGIHHTRGDRFQVNGDSAGFSGNAVLYFSRSRVQPYILGGLGVLKTSYRYGWPEYSAERYSVRKTELSMNFGGGALLFLNRHWSLDPQVRVIVSNPSGYSLANFFSMSASYHW
jgi:hypothetical protein